MTVQRAAGRRAAQRGWVAGLALFLALYVCVNPFARGGERFDRGLLWEVSRPGIDPSYIFGTIHVPDSRLLLLPDPVQEALERARLFVIELYPDEHVAARFFEAAQLEKGERLDHLLAGPDFEVLAEALQGQGLTREMVAHLKPWAALLAFTARRAEEGEITLDHELYIRARLARKRIEELDSVEEQIAVFDSVPRLTQLWLLQFAISHRDVLPRSAERTMQAYQRRDLAGIDQANRELQSADIAYEEHNGQLQRRVIHDRSVVMAYRMQPYLRRGQSFVALGALHLYGEKGVLSLLQRQYGWRVRRMY